ncbi:MAG: hypothetical protein KJP00_12605 [Bacteroidia bacterium]|nr:hypothetical protein [Bacteroidia bacterium]
MDTKLTLKLDESVIERAKQYAKEQEISLSKLIENYLQTITQDSGNIDLEISPLVKSLTGVIKLKEEDIKKKYTDYLAEKYR